MCSCATKKTFYGRGGCAGQGVGEPWELYGCPCTTDADCRGGQTCVASRSRQNARECADKKK
jgi:hypothetical protein